MHNEGAALGASRKRALMTCALAAVMLLISMLAGAPRAWAEDSTLTLQMKYDKSGTSKVISGATLTAYQVASMNDGLNNYTTLEDFASTGADFNAEMSSSDASTLASKMASIVTSKGTKGASATSDAQGNASFGKLEPGVYLVRQTGKTGDAAGYTDITPFLINVPQFGDDGVVYNVVAYPKPEPASSTPPSKKTPPPGGSTPKTGDALDVEWQTLIGLLMVGCALVASSVAIKRRRSA